MKFIAKPKLNFELVGTDIKLSSKKWYPALVADNVSQGNDGLTRYWVGDILLREDEVVIKEVVL